MKKTIFIRDSEKIDGSALSNITLADLMTSKLYKFITGSITLNKVKRFLSLTG